MKLFIVALSLLVSACSTTYQESGSSGGYSETRLQPNIFSIHFTGNGYTGSEAAADFALLRAADLTERNGFTHFIIIDEKSYSSISAITTPQQSTTTGTFNMYGNTTYGSMNTFTSGSSTFYISSPSSKITIVCFKAKPAASISYDAKFLKASLIKKYDL